MFSLSRKGKKLGLSLNASLNLNDNKEGKFQIISQHNKLVETDSLTMLTGNIPEKSIDNDQLSYPFQLVLV